MSPSLPDATASRQDFQYFLRLQTRWNDMDAYRHLNNARYYAFFDTVIMEYLQGAGGFDCVNGPVVPFTRENMCRFFRAFTFPDVIEAGLRVAHLGNSSVRYELGLFKVDHAEIYAAGYFVDVFVAAATHQPVTIPTALRAHLAALLR